MTHTLVPYAACKAIGEAQQKVLDQLLPPPGKAGPGANATGKGSAAAAAAAAAAAVGEGKKVELNEQVRATYSPTYLLYSLTLKKLFSLLRSLHSFILNPPSYRCSWRTPCSNPRWCRCFATTVWAPSSSRTCPAPSSSRPPRALVRARLRLALLRPRSRLSSERAAARAGAAAAAV